MASLWDITAASEMVKIETGSGEVVYTVTNKTDKLVRGQLRLRPQPPTAASWLGLAGEVERDFSANGTQQVVAKVTIPSGTPSGRYGLRLDVASVANPDEDYSEGATVFLEVPASEVPKKPFPWWILAVGVAALVVGLAVYALIPKTVSMPSVTGKTYTDALKILQSEGFTVEKNDIPPNLNTVTILAQDPKAEKEVKPAETKVVLTLGFKLPKITFNMSCQSAAELLKQDGFTNISVIRQPFLVGDRIIGMAPPSESVMPSRFVPVTLICQ
jgi:PASTA domain